MDMPQFIVQQEAYFESQLLGIRKRRYTYAALLYLSFRTQGMPRPLQMFGPKFKVGKEYKRVLKVLLQRRIIAAAPPPPKAEQYISYVTNRASLPVSVERKAMEILSKARPHGLNEYVVAKAAVYIAAKALGISVQRDLILMEYPYAEPVAEPMAEPVAALNTDPPFEEHG